MPAAVSKPSAVVAVAVAVAILLVAGVTYLAASDDEPISAQPPAATAATATPFVIPPTPPTTIGSLADLPASFGAEWPAVSRVIEAVQSGGVEAVLGLVAWEETQCIDFVPREGDWPRCADEGLAPGTVLRAVHVDIEGIESMMSERRFRELLGGLFAEAPGHLVLAGQSPWAQPPGRIDLGFRIAGRGFPGADCARLDWLYLWLEAGHDHPIYAAGWSCQPYSVLNTWNNLHRESTEGLSYLDAPEVQRP